MSTRHTSISSELWFCWRMCLKRTFQQLQGLYSGSDECCLFWPSFQIVFCVKTKKTKIREKQNNNQIVRLLSQFQLFSLWASLKSRFFLVDKKKDTSNTNTQRQTQNMQAHANKKNKTAKAKTTKAWHTFFFPQMQKCRKLLLNCCFSLRQRDAVHVRGKYIDC